MYHGSEYASRFEYATDPNTLGYLNMAGLHRVLKMPEYAWIIPEYALLCLNRFEYARICGDMR